MNKSLLVILWISAFGLIFFACKKNDDPTPIKSPEELAIESLAGKSSTTWTVAGGGSVFRGEGNSVTNLYQNFEITFSANQNSKTYSVSNGGDLFDNSGNWNFVAGDLTKISLAGTRPASGPEISHTKPSANDLVLIFSIVAPGAEKKGTQGAALAGNYRFNLKRKQ
ncbi:hypothetical protein MM213_12970 [Belliella sp. R4-6]|uniref:Lipocalin-like domain-containing protein n=1 Tax=Belliella alkalica TaxID=1730871 RepID=A0ABS9VDA0_9BACT|nr:hypothetical protein [Belliella alkalica]MCH7414404.1 hypothetical protein [Belliella alkalica]